MIREFQRFPLLDRVLKDLEPTDTIVDIGPGIRPVNFWPVERHICVEPCEQYAGILRERGHEVIQKTALEYLSGVQKRVGTTFMLDVLEHMDKREGYEVFERLCGKCGQVVIYTPHGFVEQTRDAWGLGEHDWQTHRSGWYPRELAWIGWSIYQDPGDSGFFAVNL